MALRAKRFGTREPESSPAPQCRPSSSSVPHPAWWVANAPTLIALISAIIAAASAVYAASMARSTKRMYQLAQKQDSLRKPKLTIYLSGAQSVRFGDDLAVMVSLTIANPTDIDNSVVRAELEVAYHKHVNQTICAKILAGHNNSAAEQPVNGEFKTPFPVPSHQSVAGALIFHGPKMITNSYTIDRYALQLEDSHSRIFVLKNISIREGLSSKGERHDQT